MWIVKRNGQRGPWILLVGLLLATPGCAPRPDPMNPAATGRPVVLKVTNHYNSPMQIYARGSGFSYRIGTVFPGMVGRFVVRQIMIVNGPVEFVAQANNRQPPIRSERLLLVPGNVVDFEIGNSPLTSIATVRP